MIGERKRGEKGEGALLTLCDFLEVEKLTVVNMRSVIGILDHFRIDGLKFRISLAPHK